MEEILARYKENGGFVFRPNDNLVNICNAPVSKCGVYIFYDISQSARQILYIGCSGHLRNDGAVHVRQTGGGGIWGRIVNGHQFDKKKRWQSLPTQMTKENISKIAIHWYVTCDSDSTHSPVFVESCLLQTYFDKFRKLPRWNRKF